MQRRAILIFLAFPRISDLDLFLHGLAVQRLFGGRTKTLLLTSNLLPKPKLLEEVNQKMKLQKAKQSLYYNEGAKEIEELCPGDTVQFQPQKSQFGKKKAWSQARVERKAKVDIILPGSNRRRESLQKKPTTAETHT